MRFTGITISIIFFGLLVNFGHSAELPSGDEIAQKIHSRSEGTTLQRNLKMTLTNKKGKSRVREAVIFRQDFDGVRKSVLFFIKPKNLKNTGFLTWDYDKTGVDDDQWVYLPAARKNRRITASKRGDYFFGTDFTYDDMKNEGKGNIEDFTRKTVGMENIEGHKCYKVEAIPVSKKIARELGYGKIIRWVDPTNWMVVKIKSWDTRYKELKTTIFKDIKQIDSIWSVGAIELRNHKIGHKTIFTFSKIQYNKSINGKRFRQNNLKRGI